MLTTQADPVSSCTPTVTISFCLAAMLPFGLFVLVLASIQIQATPARRAASTYYQVHPPSFQMQLVQLTLKGCIPSGGRLVWQHVLRPLGLLGGCGPCASSFRPDALASC